MAEINIPPEARGSSSCEPTVVSEQSSGVLALGKALVHELDLDRSVDTLGRWMAHHVAELIQDAENADESNRVSRNSACRDAILALWQHRHELPNGHRPFQKLEPVLRALNSLDPNCKEPRYYGVARPKDESADHGAEVTEWLELANGLDYSSKILIRYCLFCAAEKALDQSADWVSKAKNAGAEDAVEYRVVFKLLEERELLDEVDENSQAHEELLNRIERLEAIVELTSGLLRDLKGQAAHVDAIQGSGPT